MAYFKAKKLTPSPEKRVNESKKRYKYLYKNITDMETIKAAYKKMRRGKSARVSIQRIDANLEYYCKKMQRMLENTKPDGVSVARPELSFHPCKHEYFEIREGKTRRIQKPSITEQWVHHIIILVLEPILFKHLYNYSLGSIPKRFHGKYFERRGGAHKGKMKLEKWIHQGFKFFAKIDIRHFYDSIVVDVLIKNLEKYICDPWVIHLIRLCLQHNKRGIPLGFYLSQWLSNVFVEPIDLLIQRAGYRHIRYMDDIVIVGNNKRELHSLLVEIRKVLGSLRLRMKGNWQVCKFDYIKKDGEIVGRPIDFMGFKFYRNKTILRKKIIKHMAQIARNIGAKKQNGQKICWRQASSIVSRVGWVQYTDCYGWYLRNIKPFVEIRQMKRIVSKHDKAETNKLKQKLATA